MVFDSHGRRYRWVKDVKLPRQESVGTWGKTPTAWQQDIDFVQGLEKWLDSLNRKLEVQKRAISNWKKLKLVLVMMKVCGGKTVAPDEMSTQQMEDSFSLLQK